MLLALGIAAAATYAWIADQDYRLDGVAASGAAIVSDDPTLTTAFVSSGFLGQRTDIFAFSTNSTTTYLRNNFPLKIPIAKGKTIYVNSSTLQVVFLSLSPVSAENIAT
jgi:hypothetical protein